MKQKLKALAAAFRIKTGYRLGYLLLCTASSAIIYSILLPNLLIPGWGAYLKLRGHASYCSWRKVATLQLDLDKFNQIFDQAQKQGTSYRADPNNPKLGTVALSDGLFWVRPASKGPGVAWLIAEHRWMTDLEGDRMVRPGDVVLDIGAHVGFFTSTALRQGALKVIAVEPDPYSVECLRRNFPAEISSGRVVIVEAGAWSSRGDITLSLGDDPGWNSMMEKQDAGEMVVPVLPIDDMVRELGLTRVDFIKMDIEGAELEALKGARRTLSRLHPRIMIDTYQWAHDMDGLLAEVRRGHHDYQPNCGPCEPAQKGVPGIVPHMTFYETGD